MQESVSNPSWLILADTRCSDKLRELSAAQHWPVIEYTNDHEAARAVVAMGAEYVAIELCRVSQRLPELAALLAALDTTEYVVCITSMQNSPLQHDAAQCGVVLCDSVECFARHLGLLHPLILRSTSESEHHGDPASTAAAHSTFKPLSVTTQSRAQSAGSSELSHR